MKTSHSISAAGVALAMALIFSCSSDDDGSGLPLGEKAAGYGVCDASETEKCCGAVAYNPQYEFCYNNSKVGTLCGERKEAYDPGLYQCKPKINPNGIYLKTPVAYGGEDYEAVLIGEQVWLARNLNYKTESGSECYDYTRDVDFKNCSTYGRLYTWFTAMEACPDGWHLPDSMEWQELADFVGRGAGKYLKAEISNWSSGNDAYGFAALPGGNCLTFDHCIEILNNNSGTTWQVDYCEPYKTCGRLNQNGVWWTATDLEIEGIEGIGADKRCMGHNACARTMEMIDGSSNIVISGGLNGNKSGHMNSVRCVQNNNTEVSQ